MMKRVASFIALACAVALAGCNTMHGIGKDIERAGGAISGAAK